MKRNYCILLMIAIISVLTHVVSADMYYSSDGEAPDIATLFSNLDSRIVGVEISGIARVNKQYMTFDQLEQLFNEVAVKFEHIVSVVKAGEGLSTGVRQIKGQALKDDTLYTIALNNGYNLADNNGSFETYIVVNIAFESMFDVKVEGARQILQNFLADYSSEPCIGTLYRGCIQKKLDKKAMINTSNQIFDAFEGKIVEGIVDGHLVSQTGYSSLIENSPGIYGKMINLNVALRYNEYEDATYIWLGTPVIFTSY